VNLFFFIQYFPKLSDPSNSSGRRKIPLHHKTVMRVLNKDFAYIQWTRQTDLGTCPECSDFSARRKYWESVAGVKTDLHRMIPQNRIEEFKEFALAEALHKTEEERERNGYTSRVSKVIECPKDYILMTFDYTKSVQLPRTLRGSKVRVFFLSLYFFFFFFNFVDTFLFPQDEIEARQFDILLGSVVVIANKVRKNFPFLHDRCVEKGANSIGTMLYCLVNHLKSCPDTDASHAHTLYLQCDGGSENINRSIFGLCDMFVRMGWFKNVYLNRLPVGHSHQLVDQYFSVIHPRIKSVMHCRDIPEIMHNLSQKKFERDNDSFPIWLQQSIDFRSYFSNTNMLKNMRKRVYGWWFEGIFGGASAESPEVNLWYEFFFHFFLFLF